MLLEAEIGKGGGLAAEPDRNPFVVGDNGKPVFPNQLLQAGHFVRFAADVDLPVIDSSPIEILTQRFAVRATICGEDENGI